MLRRRRGGGGGATSVHKRVVYSAGPTAKSPVDKLVERFQAQYSKYKRETNTYTSGSDDAFPDPDFAGAIFACVRVRVLATIEQAFCDAFSAHVDFCDITRHCVRWRIAIGTSATLADLTCAAARVHADARISVQNHLRWPDAHSGTGTTGVYILEYPMHAFTDAMQEEFRAAMARVKKAGAPAEQAPPRRWLHFRLPRVLVWLLYTLRVFIAKPVLVLLRIVYATARARKQVIAELVAIPLAYVLVREYFPRAYIDDAAREVACVLLQYAPVAVVWDGWIECRHAQI